MTVAYGVLNAKTTSISFRYENSICSTGLVDTKNEAISERLPQELRTQAQVSDTTLRIAPKVTLPE